MPCFSICANKAAIFQASGQNLRHVEKESNGESGLQLAYAEDDVHRSGKALAIRRNQIGHSPAHVSRTIFK